jgi:putative endonuclease
VAFASADHTREEVLALPQALGLRAEALAAAYLRLLGCEVDSTRVRFAGVEVDLVAREGATRVLVEVKIRSRTDYGSAAESVGYEKSERLRRAARALVQKEPGPVRIDVVAIDLAGTDLRLRWIRDAVHDR